ncbi:AMP-binding protein, partial [Paenibacillus sp. P3E]|uniref:AMP-binding protein n=1 Tax=Paenibacillus sp. P3E TaxID=1349435 RepID=UPI000ACE23C9
IEDQALNSGEQTALIYKDKEISYKELNERSNRVAKYLSSVGVTRDTIVGLMMHRSLEMIISIVGILKAGGAYLPIDPEFPSERIKYMLEDSKASLIITNSDINSPFLNGFHVKKYKEIMYASNRIIGQAWPSTTGSSDQLAYLIYTSGSTGKPKGVMIEHRSVVNFIKGITENINFNEDSIILALTTVCVDIFVLEAILPLTKGGKVIIADEEEQKDPVVLSKLIIDKYIN